MKFLIQIQQLAYAGAEKVLVNFANYLVRCGHEVEILETREGDCLKPQLDSRVKFDSIYSKAYMKRYCVLRNELTLEKDPIKTLLKYTKFIFRKTGSYRRIAERAAKKRYFRKRYNVAINYGEWESPRFIINNIQADKYIQWIHTDAAKLKTGRLDKLAKLCEKMDAVVCVAETAKRSFCELYPRLAGKTHAIYNFFGVKDIQSKAEEKVHYEKGAFNILSVGRLTESKGYMRALKVMRRLKSEGYDFTWHIIGEGVNREKIERYIETHKMRGYVKLLGLKDNPYPYMKRCDLFFLPSLYEGFPTVIVEAKALEKPVLAAEVSGIREQIEDGKHGIITENSEEGIYEGMKRILDEPALLKKLSRNDGMEKVFDNDVKYDRFIKIIGL